MARVTIKELATRYAHFGLYTASPCGAEPIVVRRKMGETTDYMHDNARKVSRQREYFTLASQHWSHLTPTQKAYYRGKMAFVSRIGSPSEDVLLKGRQLFISQEISQLNIAQRQLVTPFEVCIILCDEAHNPLSGHLWLELKPTEEAEWNFLWGEELIKGNWLFKNVPPDQFVYHPHGRTGEKDKEAYEKAITQALEDYHHAREVAWNYFKDSGFKDEPAYTNALAKAWQDYQDAKELAKEAYGGEGDYYDPESPQSFMIQERLKQYHYHVLLNRHWRLILLEKWHKAVAPADFDRLFFEEWTPGAPPPWEQLLKEEWTGELTPWWNLLFTEPWTGELFGWWSYLLKEEWTGYPPSPGWIPAIMEPWGGVWTMIDMGSVAGDRAAYTTAGYTYILKENQANLSGKIKKVEVFVNQAMTALEVGIFIKTGTNTFTTRSYASLGAVTPGYHIFDVNLDVVAGDYIGFYDPAGRLDRSDTGFQGDWYVAGDKIPCTNQAFTSAGSRTTSLFGYGET